MTDRSAGENDRFEALYEEHYPAILRYAARRVGAEAARDITAETFTIAWRRLSQVPAGQPLPWLYATARNCLANELRRRERGKRLDSRMRTEATRGPAVASAEPSEQVADRLAVLAALATLRPKDQEALRLIEWEHLDIAAAARVMGCSAGTFRVWLHRARRRLARALDQASGFSTDAAAAPACLPARTEIRP